MSRRKQDPLVRAQRAAQIVDNPEFQRAFDKVRDNLVNEMERLKLDGSNDAAAVSLIQQLQAAKNFKAEFVRLIASGERTVKRSERDDEEQPFDPLAPTQSKGK